MSKEKQRGGFAMGLIVGLLLGLGIALGVALYVTKAPVPFVNKLPQRTAEQDAQEAERNKNWDPNAPLAGRTTKAAAGVVTPAPAPQTPAVTPAPQVTAGTTPAPAVEGRPAERSPAAAPVPSAKPEARPAETRSADGARPDGSRGSFFVQAGAFTRMEDAEQQRAKLAIQGFSAKVMEREQSGRTVFRVRLGPFDSRDEAESQQKKLEGAGIEANLVAIQR